MAVIRRQADEQLKQIDSTPFVFIRLIGPNWTIQTRYDLFENEFINFEIIVTIILGTVILVIVL